MIRTPINICDEPQEDADTARPRNFNHNSGMPRWVKMLVVIVIILVLLIIILHLTGVVSGGHPW